MLILEYFIIVYVNQASFYTVISNSILKSTPLFRRMKITNYGKLWIPVNRINNCFDRSRVQLKPLIKLKSAELILQKRVSNHLTKN